MKNPPVFNYEKSGIIFSKDTIRGFLDSMNGLPVELVDTVKLAELLRFCGYEGKKG